MSNVPHEAGTSTVSSVSTFTQSNSLWLNFTIHVQSRVSLHILPNASSSVEVSFSKQ